MCIWTHPHSRRQGKISLEGYTPAKMAARAATPPLSLHFPFKFGVWERTREKLGAHLGKTGSAPKKNWERTQEKLEAHPVKISLLLISLRYVPK